SSSPTAPTPSRSRSSAGSTSCRVTGRRWRRSPPGSRWATAARCSCAGSWSPMADAVQGRPGAPGRSAPPDVLAVAEVERAFRAESGRALATIARLTRDVDLAEDAVQEAFLAALRTWPAPALPPPTGPCIPTPALHWALDVLRAEAPRPGREEPAARAAPLAGTPPVLHPVADDQLRLLFTCCHPALPPQTRVALALRLVCGRSTGEIARALLQGEEAVAKRIQRGKRKIRAEIGRAHV